MLRHLLGFYPLFRPAKTYFYLYAARELIFCGPRMNLSLRPLLYTLPSPLSKIRFQCIKSDGQIDLLVIGPNMEASINSFSASTLKYKFSPTTTASAAAQAHVTRDILAHNIAINKY